VLSVLRRRRSRPVNEVLFFPCEAVCVEHILNPSLPLKERDSCFCSLPHGQETSIHILLRHILSASSSLDVCMFAFTNTDLSRAVLALRSRGVAIRVLVEEKNISICGSQIPVLLGAGVCVRFNRTPISMHHKFAVVDDRRLITGSLNWTCTGVHDSNENVIVTEVRGLVRPYVTQFARLWL
ncbi:unnamed protein product, partial [Tetraodon nigroviridis]